MLQINLTIQVESDFHIGTGSGRGRATDAVFLRDRHSLPYIPGSTIKGLAAFQAKQLMQQYQQFGTVPQVNSPAEDLSASPFREIFGGGKDGGYSEDRVYFDDAYQLGPNSESSNVVRSGRNARDRITGRAKDDHLFFYEDAPANTFVTTLTSDHLLSLPALALLVMSLRRMEALGGQRQRGKGKVNCTIEVADGGDFKSPEGQVSSLNGLILPAEGGEKITLFRNLAADLLSGKKPPNLSPVQRTHKVSLENQSDDRPKSEESCWLIFGIARSPITTAQLRAVENIIESGNFLSGSTIRGAVAWSWLRSGLSDSDPIFNEAIVQEKVRFGPLYPANSNLVEGTMPIPAPASFYTCKQHPGPLDSSPRQHGIADRFRHALESPCPFCQGTLKPLGGFLQFDGKRDEFEETCHVHTRQTQPAMQVLQRTGISHQSLRAEDGQLYGLEAIPEATVFAGYAWGPDRLLRPLLSKWTMNADNKAGGILRVGKIRTRGLGKLELKCKPSDTQNHPSYPGLIPAGSQSTPPANDFHLTLYSDLIASDSLMRPITRLDAKQLWRLVNLAWEEYAKPAELLTEERKTETERDQEADALEIQSGYVTTQRIGGYIGKVGLPRSADLAIAAGSTWRLAWNEETTAQTKQAVWTKLLVAQQWGIGLRCADGFGRIVINSPMQQNLDFFRAPQLTVHCDLIRYPDFERRGMPPIPKRGSDPSQITERNLKYYRLLQQIVQAKNPLDAFLNAYQNVRTHEGKGDSFIEFVQRHRRHLFPEMKDAKLVAHIKSIASNPQQLADFKARLTDLANGTVPPQETHDE